MGRPRTSAADREFRSEVAKKLRQVMKDRNLTEADAARQLKISRQAFNKYVREEATPHGEILARACALWDVTLKYRGADFTGNAFIATPTKAQPEVLQMDLFAEPLKVENKHVLVTIQRSQKQTLQVTIQVKKADLSSRPKKAAKAG